MLNRWRFQKLKKCFQSVGTNGDFKSIKKNVTQRSNFRFFFNHFVFFVCIFPGPVVGVVLGMLGSFSLGYIIDDALTEITLTVIVCFSAFMISEATKVNVTTKYKIKTNIPKGWYLRSVCSVNCRLLICTYLHAQSAMT